LNQVLTVGNSSSIAVVAGGFMINDGQNQTAASYPAIFGSANVLTNTATATLINGRYNSASGQFAHAEGRETTARASYSHTDGYRTITGYYTPGGGLEGYYAHAEGYQTTADGIGSHAEGLNTVTFYTSNTYGAHAEGGYTTALGTGAHAEGNNTFASASYSHAGGYYTTTNANYQTTVGQYNSEDTTNQSAFIVGTGTSGTLRTGFKIYRDGTGRTRINIQGLPTSAAGLSSGDLYVDIVSGAKVIRIV
jgi:hypothetical protein